MDYLQHLNKRIMWRLLKFIVTGSWHEHEWETTKEEELYTNEDYKYAWKTRYTMKCKGCGNMKKKEL